MSSNQVQIAFMLKKLEQWNKQLGGNNSKKINGTEFDFLQEEFLTRRHQVQKNQDIREKQGGYSTTNANVGYQIRQGISKMKQILEKLKQEQRRLAKKKKDPPEILERKRKIVQNCEMLLKDLEDRQNQGMPTNNRNKAITLTDLKVKLLKEIDENNDAIHQKNDSDGKMTENMEEDKKQVAEWKKNQNEMDDMIDEIINGVKIVKGKVKNINEAQDTINQKTKKADEKVGVLSNRIKGDNEKLKKIIEDFKPSRCCLYVAMFLLLAGLVVCVIKLLI